MRIKRLVIRNIASIEKADIDFENDLRDPETGAPASVFLITGDTGSGKSVILDCISMALYGTTPRVRSVNGSRKNTFRSESGEEISVSDITQYTRIGISSKDPCYSQLTFTGNDGVEYISQFCLGRTNRNNYRKPEWTLQVGARDLLAGRKEEIRTKITEAVGLTFDQFNRMAMLAQGQFATFLTGRKEERELILEQLTDTEIFSRYGEAINTIFKRSKAAKEQIESQFAIFKGLILPDEEIASFRRQLSDNLSVLKEKKEAAAALTNKIGLIDRLKRADETLRECRGDYASLSADLLDREAKSAEKQLALTTDKEWIDSQSDRAELYTESSLIGEKLFNFASLNFEIERKKALRTEEAAKSPKLEAELKLATEEAEKATKDVEIARADIEFMEVKRQALNPEMLYRSRDELKARISQIELLQKNILLAEEHHKEAEVAQSELDKLSREAEALTLKVDRLTESRDRAEKEAERAEERYTTMHLSLSENFRELRRRLTEEHASNCPLCGQAIDAHTLSADEDHFEQILSPLEKEKLETSSELKRLKKELEEAQNLLSSQKGTIQAKTSELAKLIKRNEKMDKEIKTELADFILSDEDDPQQVLKAAKVHTEVILYNYTVKIAECETLQKKIGESLGLLKKLDEIKTRKTTELQRVSEAMVRHQGLINSLDTYIKENSERLTTFGRELDERLVGYAAEWRLNPKATREGLMKEASTYQTRLKTYEKEEVAYRRDADALKTLTEIRDQVRPLLDELDNESSKKGKTLDSKSIEEVRALWNTLFASASSADRESKECVRIISECESVLPDATQLKSAKETLEAEIAELQKDNGTIESRLKTDADNRRRSEETMREMERREETFRKWEKMNRYFGGTRFRTLVQSHILRPLLRNANVYLRRITDHYLLTCSDENEQLSILVIDRYNKNERRSVTVLSGGERFMISLALSLALSAMNRPDMNVDILFIDEGFGTLDGRSLEMVLGTLRRLPEISGGSDRRVGVISHREELREQIDVQIRLLPSGSGRSRLHLPHHQNKE